MFFLLFFPKCGKTKRETKIKRVSEKLGGGDLKRPQNINNCFLYIHNCELYRPQNKYNSGPYEINFLFY